MCIWGNEQWVYGAMEVWDYGNMGHFLLPCSLFYTRCLTHPFLHEPICHLHPYVPYTQCSVCPLPHMPIALYPQFPIRPKLDIIITPYAHCLVCTFLNVPHYSVPPLPHMPLLQTSVGLSSLCFMPLAPQTHCYKRLLLYTTIAGLALANNQENYFVIALQFRHQAGFLLPNVSSQLVLFTLGIRLQNLLLKPALSMRLSFFVSRPDNVTRWF